jgi:hypothetical protein
MADAASRTAVPQQDLVVTQADAVEWPDGSLGCPEEGMMYTMAIVPGYQVLVQAGDAQLDYRADQKGFFKLCAG